MSLENVQVYRNYPGWSTYQVTLDNSERNSLVDLLSPEEQEAIAGRPIARITLHLATGQTVNISSGPTGAEIPVVAPSAAGPGQRIDLPVLNAQRAVLLRGSGNLLVAVYFAG